MASYDIMLYCYLVLSFPCAYLHCVMLLSLSLSLSLSLTIQSRLLSDLALPLPPVLATGMPGGDRCRVTTLSPVPLVRRPFPRRSQSLVAAVLQPTRRDQCPSHHTMHPRPMCTLHPHSRPRPLRLELCQRMLSPYQGMCIKLPTCTKVG